MSLEITVALADPVSVTKWMRGLYRDQIPWATANALNATAFDARKTLVNELRQHFEIRTDWTSRRMRVGKARKKRLPHVAYVGSTAPYMELQVTGGVKRSMNKLMGIPTSHLRARSSDGQIKKSLWPRKFLRSKRVKKRRKVHTVGLRKGAAVIQTVGGERVHLYTLAQKAIVKPRTWPLESTVRRVVARRWAKNATRALDRAIKTARKGKRSR